MNKNESRSCNYEELSKNLGTIDFGELKNRILEWSKDAKWGEREEKDREASLLQRKVSHQAQLLQESDHQILSLTAKFRSLVSNYAAFSSVLELKNQLSEEITKLKTQNIEIEEKRKSEDASWKEQLDEVKKTWSAILAESREENNEKLKTLEAEWEKKAEEETAEAKTAKEKLREAKKDHLRTTDTLRRQHHEELEKLRGEMIRLQRSLSNNSLTNLDVFSGKLHSAKEAFEKSLAAKDDKIVDLETKLKASEDMVRHMKLLSVVRNAQSAFASKAPEEKETHAHSNSGLVRVRENQGKPEGNRNEASTSDTMVSDSTPLVTKKPFSDTKSKEGGKTNVVKKLNKRRKLFCGGETFLEENNSN